MKFCTKCGNQVDDNALFCAACGNRMAAEPAPVATPAEAAPAQPVYTQAPVYTQTPVYTNAPAETPVAPAQPTVAPAQPAKSGVSVLLGFIGDLVSLFAAFFGVVATATPYVRVSLNYSKYSSSGYYASTYFEPNEVCAVFALLLGLGALALGIVSFIMTLKGRPEKEVLFKSIKKLAMVTLIAIFGIVLVANL